MTNHPYKYGGASEYDSFISLHIRFSDGVGGSNLIFDAASQCLSHLATTQTKVTIPNTQHLKLIARPTWTIPYKA